MIVDAGVVDEDIKSAEVGRDGSGSRFGGGVIGDIDRNEMSCDSFGCEPGGGFFSGGLLARSQQDCYAAVPDLPRDFKSNPFVRSSNERDFPSMNFA